MADINNGNNNFSPNQNNGMTNNAPNANPQNWAQSQRPQMPGQNPQFRNQPQNANLQNNANLNQQVPQQPGQPPKQGVKGVETKKTLSEDDKERLRNHNVSNEEVKKLKKRVKKPEITENARPLTKVRRLYSARIAHRIYPEQMREISRLRALAGESGKKGAALIGGAAKKTRNLVASILIVLAILAVVGTGTLVTILMLNNNDGGSTPPSGTIEFTGNTNISETITNYNFGDDIDAPIGIANLTNRNLRFLFYVTISAPTDGPLSEGLDFSELEIEFLGMSTAWGYGGSKNGINYYTSNEVPAFVNSETTTNQINIVTGYKITVKDEANGNNWLGKTVVLTFNIVGCENNEALSDEINKIGVTTSAGANE